MVTKQQKNVFYFLFGLSIRLYSGLLFVFRSGLYFVFRGYCLLFRFPAFLPCGSPSAFGGRTNIFWFKYTFVFRPICLFPACTLFFWVIVCLFSGPALFPTLQVGVVRFYLKSGPPSFLPPSFLLPPTSDIAPSFK